MYRRGLSGNALSIAESLYRDTIVVVGNSVMVSYPELLCDSHPIHAQVAFRKCQLADNKLWITCLHKLFGYWSAVYTTTLHSLTIYSDMSRNCTGYSKIAEVFFCLVSMQFGQPQVNYPCANISLIIQIWTDPISKVNWLTTFVVRHRICFMG